MLIIAVKTIICKTKLHVKYCLLIKEKKKKSGVLFLLSSIYLSGKGFAVLNSNQLLLERYVGVPFQSYCFFILCTILPL